MKAIGWITVTFIGLFVTSLYRGFVLSLCWVWFVVPFGAPAISIAHAMGISLVVGFLTSQSGKKPDPDDEFAEVLMRGLVQSTLFTTIVWPIAWAISWFV